MDPHQLLDSVRGWLWKLSLRAARRHRLDADDVFQTSCLRVLAAARTYDAARGKASTWATFVHRSAVDQLLRQRARNVPAVAVGPEALERHHRPEPDEPEPPPHLDRLAAALNLLPVRERAILEEHHGLRDRRPEPMTEIGQRIGVSRQRVFQLVRRGESLLAAALLSLAHPPAV